MTESHRKVASSLFCFIGCVLLVPSSILLIRGLTFADLAVGGFIAACACLTIAAALSLYDAYLDLEKATDEATIDTALQAVYTVLYMFFGAAFFLIGSVMYLPQWGSTHILGTTAADLGTWVFRFGSFAYLGGNYRSACALVNNTQQNGFWRKEDMMVAVGVAAFMLGSLLYIAGGIFGQIKIGDPLLMADLWFLGSCCFAGGSLVFFKLNVCDHLKV